MHFISLEAFFQFSIDYNIGCQCDKLYKIKYPVSIISVNMDSINNNGPNPYLPILIPLDKYTSVA
jgi:hypothetical protein